MTGRPLAPLAALLLSTVAAFAATQPRPTATPEPHLSGGFGKNVPVGAAARRRAEKKIRITNESLVTDPLKGKLTTSARPAAPPSSPAAAVRTRGGPTPAASEVTPTPGGAAQAQGTEEYWRTEARRVRERVATLRASIVRLEAETRKLEADFYSWDDGAYRDGVIKPSWDKAREDLATARRELPLAERDLDDLPDRARRSGALPGWIRE